MDASPLLHISKSTRSTSPSLLKSASPLPVPANTAFHISKQVGIVVGDCMSVAVGTAVMEGVGVIVGVTDGVTLGEGSSVGEGIIVRVGVGVIKFIVRLYAGLSVRMFCVFRS